ncbi:MAG TPA: TRAP transporter TatT component family protein [Gemmatimonadales bacterium]
MTTTRAIIWASCALLAAGCSIKRLAVNKMGDALASSGTTFASDDDPDLIADAVPFSLKLMESLLAASPRHRGLLLATASGFTQYAYAFVQQEADELETKDFAKATAGRARAKRLYLRARDYGLRGLETRHKSFSAALRAHPREASRLATKDDVPLLYWTAAAWGAAVSLSKDDPNLVADQPVFEALIDRALELDETFDSGTIHAFLISYEPARQGGSGDPYERARQHFERAVALTNGQAASPFVSYAEAVAVSKQDRQEFRSVLQRALAIDPDARPEWRLANLIMQRRARWLLAREDDLFIDTGKSGASRRPLTLPLGRYLGEAGAP